MPFSSKSQSRFMHAAAANPKMARKLGIKPAAAKKFVEHSHGQKVRELPEYAPKKKA